MPVIVKKAPDRAVRLMNRTLLEAISLINKSSGAPVQDGVVIIDQDTALQSLAQVAAIIAGLKPSTEAQRMARYAYFDNHFMDATHSMENVVHRS